MAFLFFVIMSGQEISGKNIFNVWTPSSCMVLYNRINSEMLE